MEKLGEKYGTPKKKVPVDNFTCLICDDSIRSDGSRKSYSHIVPVGTSRAKTPKELGCRLTAVLGIPTEEFHSNVLGVKCERVLVNVENANKKQDEMIVNFKNTL